MVRKSAPRKSPRADVPRLGRDDWLDAAFAAVVEGGFDNVRVLVLADRLGVTRGSCLVLNLPGRPKSIRETLEGVRADDGQVLVHGVFASVPYCIELMGGPYIETRPEYVTAFRPKKK